MTASPRTSGCVCPPAGCHTDPADPDSIVCPDYGCTACLDGPAATACVPLIPELAAVLDPTRQPTEQEWEQARAEVDYALSRRAVTPGGEDR